MELWPECHGNTAKGVTSPDPQSSPGYLVNMTTGDWENQCKTVDRGNGTLRILLWEGNWWHCEEGIWQVGEERWAIWKRKIGYEALTVIEGRYKGTSKAMAAWILREDPLSNTVASMCPLRIRCEEKMRGAAFSGGEAASPWMDVRSTGWGLFWKVMNLVLDMISVRSQWNICLSEEKCSANKESGSAAQEKKGRVGVTIRSAWNLGRRWHRQHREGS